MSRTAAPPVQREPATDAVWTIPNALTMLRLAGVPVFLWLLLGVEADGAAVVLLMVSGWTDFFDGVIARRFGQESRLGRLLDPVADRLYTASTLLAFVVRDVVPLWLLVGLLARDVLLTGVFARLRRAGWAPPAVNYAGKAATWNLLSAFPLLLLAAGEGAAAGYVRPFGWAFMIWGTCLYWWAGVLYVVQARELVRRVPAGPGAQTGAVA